MAPFLSYTPETAPEVCGIHDDVGFFGQRVVLPDLCFAQAAVDGLAAASVLRGELRGRLFACTIGCLKLVILKALAAIELSVAVVAFVALSAIAPLVLFDSF